MRVIAGTAKGITLAVPRGDTTRPTSDRTRAAMFSSLGPCLLNATVLDLFAGSGSLGLEAASRGAGSVLFVEESHPVIRCLERNITACRKNLTGACHLTICRTDVFAQLKRLVTGRETFTLILADPPYGPLAQQILCDPNLPLLLDPTGMFVLESASRTKLVPSPFWMLRREMEHGDTRVSVFVRQ